MAPKKPRTLFDQTRHLFEAISRPFSKEPVRPTGGGGCGGSRVGQHTLLPLSTGLRLTLGCPVSQTTQTLLSPYQQPDAAQYLLPWLDAIRLFPQHKATALPEALRSALQLPPWPGSSNTSALATIPDDADPVDAEETDDDPQASPQDSEGLAVDYSEQAEEWLAAASELQSSLPPLSDVGSFHARLELLGHTLRLSLLAGAKPIDPIGPGWLIELNSSFPRVALPLWVWQLQGALPYLQRLLDHADTRREAYGLIQQVQEAVLLRTPQHTLTLDSQVLNDQRFVSVSHFQVAVTRSRYGNSADVLPYSDQLLTSLGLEKDEFQRSMQHALAQWNGQDSLLLKDGDQNQVHASILLTPTQREALRHLKANLFQKPLKEIREFVYFPTQIAKSEAFQSAFQLDLSEYGPRVTGVGPIVHSPGAFGKGNAQSLFARMVLDQPDGPVDADDGGRATAVDNTPSSQVVYAEGDDARNHPLLALTLPVSNPDTEAPLQVHLDMATAEDTLQAMKIALETDATGAPLFPLTDALTGEAVELPINAPFIEALHATVQTETKALKSATGQADAPVDEAMQRNQYAQTQADDFEVAKARDTDAQLFGQAMEWTKKVPHLKSHITLYGYQRDGVAWLTNAFLQGRPGVLFADDMGLGKTLQSLAFLSLLMEQAWHQRHSQAGSLMFEKEAFRRKGPCLHPVLVVVPPVLIKNFKKQADDFFEQSDTYFPMLLLHAEQGESPQDFYLEPGKKGKEVDDGIPRLDVTKLRNYRIIVTTYDYAVTYQHSFARMRWSVLLCDEVQKAKNSRSKVSYALKAIASNSCFNVMMTGTPIENDLSDLYNIMDIAWPGYLVKSPQEFRKKYPALFNLELDDDPATHEATVSENMIRLKQELGFGDIQQGIMIGRLKTEVGEGLPQKFDGPEQEIITVIPHQEYRDLRDRDLQPLQLLQELKRYSLHPSQHEPFAPHDVEQWVLKSPRLKAVLEKLDTIRTTGEKALLFCEFHVVQEALQQAINRRYQLPTTLKAINSNLADKSPVLARFQNHPGFCALVLSPKCAGMGLNLQEANHVFHVSRWWNPAVEDQATCRAYRTGQKKDVYVYYCLSRLDHAPNGEKTFDEALHELLGEKRRKRTDLLDPGYVQFISEATLADKMQITLKEDIASVDALSQSGSPGKAFERWVKTRLEKEGYRVDRPHDTGIDFIVYPRDGSEPLGIQVKHTGDHSAKTILAHLSRFPSDLRRHQLRKGAFITNQSASVAHRQQLENEELVSAQMVDRQDLVQYLAGTRSLMAPLF